MKITRNIFIILYAILLVINDPQVARAHTIEGIGISQAGIIENKPVYVLIRMKKPVRRHIILPIF